MSRKYKFYDPDALYFVTFTVVHWIDVFIRNQYRDILLDSWKHCQDKKGLEIYSWCIMSNHVHMIIGSQIEKLENIMRDMKSHTSTQLRLAINNNIHESRKQWMLEIMVKTGLKNKNNNDFQFWQQHNHPILLDTNKIMQQKLDYIHNNPVKAGFVDNPDDYLYSSARDYAGIKGLIEINFIE